MLKRILISRLFSNQLAVSTICPTTSIASTVTAASLPAQCSTYQNISDHTRSPDYTGTVTYSDYEYFFPTPLWVRFVQSSGTLIANCPITENHCGSQLAGWYSGIYPSLAGGVNSGVVCFNDGITLCAWPLTVLITNCNGFYIYYLSQPSIDNSRFCTI